MVLTHGAIDTPTGSLLRASLEQAQLEVGLGIPFLDADFEEYGFLLTDCLWKAIWEFVSTYQISLEYPDNVLPKRQRHNDQFIMEVLSDCDELSPADLISCNRCRLALESVTLADIVTGDGSRFRPACLDMDLSLSPRSRWEFPIKKPSRGDRASWIKGLQLLSSESFLLAHPNRLGAWIAEPHKHWEWFFDNETGTLYRQAHNFWHIYTQSNAHNTRHRSFRRTAVTPTAPSHLLRATARLDQQGRAFFEGASSELIPPAPSYPSIKALIESWPDSWPLTHSHFPPDPSSLIQAIRDGTAIGVSDGSYMPTINDRVGAAAWKVENPTSHQAMEGTTRTAGEPLEVDSYRSKLQGVHAMLLGLLAFCTYYKVPDGKVTLGCDNSTCVHLSRGTWLKVKLRSSNCDLLCAI
jgi:hypothetical protein